MYEGAEGAETIVDDILICGETLAQHDARLRQVPLESSEAQLKIKQIQVSNRVYNGSWAPIGELLDKNVEWHWEERHQNCFQQLKDLVSSAPVLKYYDVSKPVRLSVDASSTGLDAVLLKGNQRVAYASKSLTIAQQRYAQIETEMLVIIFGAKKYHQYIFDKTVTVQTYHKPLDVIVKKPLHSVPTRLQRILLKLQQYDLNVKYVPGKLLHVADVLSKAHLPKEASDLEEEFEVHLLLAVSENKMQEISRATENDANLRVVKSLILNGWPNNRLEVPSKVPPELWNVRDELTIHLLLHCCLYFKLVECVLSSRL